MCYAGCILVVTVTFSNNFHHAPLRGFIFCGIFTSTYRVVTVFKRVLGLIFPIGSNFYSGFFIYIVSSTHFLMRLIISLLSKNQKERDFCLYTPSLSTVFPLSENIF